MWFEIKGKERKYRDRKTVRTVTRQIQKSGHAEHKDDADFFKHCMMKEVNGTRQTGHSRKTWWNCVNKNMKSMACSNRVQSLGINGEGRLRLRKTKGQVANPGSC